MIPLVDMHCHLLAGLDDGPQTDEEAEAMCRLAYEEGIRMAAATAHQNERWRLVTPERIRSATTHLAACLSNLQLGLSVFPSAEVMVEPDTETLWREGRLLTVANRGKYLLIEMPNDLFVDVTDIVHRLRQVGIRPILAHPERHEELLHDAGQIEKLIEAGCLVQVSTGSITDPKSRADARMIKSWVQRGIVHCLGSDGHSPTRRPPRMRAAYEQIARWAGHAAADRIGSTCGMAILQGLPLELPRPEPRRASWLARIWG